MTFVETTTGWINVAHVTRIAEIRESMVLYGGDDRVLGSVDFDGGLQHRCLGQLIPAPPGYAVIVAEQPDRMAETPQWRIPILAFEIGGLSEEPWPWTAEGRFRETLWAKGEVAPHGIVWPDYHVTTEWKEGWYASVGTFLDAACRPKPVAVSGS